jgi:endonuclease/exonuclease/phosphatase family metal-dependent hydrolase
MVIKIATWNVGGCILGESHQSDGMPDTQYYADILKFLDLDIVCLQEAQTFSDGTSQLQAIIDDLGEYHACNQPISKSHFLDSAQLSLAVLTRHKILNAKYFSFDNPHLSATYLGNFWSTDSYDKGYLWLQIDLDGKTLNLLNLHMFPLHYFNVGIDDPRIRGIWESINIALITAAKDSPCIACMDLNTGDIQSVLAPSLDYMQPVFSGVTTTPEKGQQDYILHTRDFAVVEQAVIPTKCDHFLAWSLFSY